MTMMKAFFLAALTAILLVACSQGETMQEQVCHIHGTVPMTYNGRRVYLVPLEGPATAMTVETATIEGGAFEMTIDTTIMAKLLLHYSMDTQTLLVVTEPGEVHAIIDSVSHVGGTPLNDSLEHWKQETEAHNRQMVELRRQLMTRQADSTHQAYMQFTHRMAVAVDSTVLGSFLSKQQ